MIGRSPIGWALQPLKKYATFSGRAPRAEFWWFILFLMISYILFWFAVVGAVSGMAASQTEPSLGIIGAIGVAGILMLLVWLALIIPSIAVQVRRLHDTNRSGWWIGGFYLIYLAYVVLIFSAMSSALAAGADGSTDMAAAGPLMAGSGILGLLMLVYGIVLLVFFCLPGTRGANSYGPDPYGADVSEVFA